MSTDTDTTFAGRPINGDISHYNPDTTKEQRPIEELVAKLDSLLAFPEIEKVRWRQYTPYFNDGDPCNFNIYSTEAKFTGIDEGGDDGWQEICLGYPDGYWQTHDHAGRDGKAKPDPADQSWSLYGTDFTPSAELARAGAAFASALENGTHYTQLNKVFGDPAEVTAAREGFDVEYYDHD